MGTSGVTLGLGQALFAPVNVSAYGAVGNGTTDDTLAIRAALASGFDITFTKGKTYLVSGTLHMTFAGQSVWLSGATIKRANQVTTTLSAPIVGGIGAHIYPVTSTTGFFVGQTISSRQGGPITAVIPTASGTGYTTGAGLPTCTISGGGGTGATVTPVLDTATTKIVAYTIGSGGSGYISQPTNTATGGTGTGAAFSCAATTIDQQTGTGEITSIVPGVSITVNSTFDTSMSAGATVYTCGYLFSLEGDGCRLEGPGVLETNKANASIYAWQSTAGVRVFANNCTVANFVIDHAPGEGILIYHSNILVSHVTFNHINGNCTHFTNAPSLGDLPTFQGHDVVTYCNGTYINEDPMVGHADGAFIWSNTIKNGTISHCLAYGTPLVGFGVLHAADDSDSQFIGNVAELCLQAGFLMSGSTTAPSRSVVVGNKINDCGTYALNAGILVQGSAPQYPLDVTITGNQITCLNSLANGITCNQAQRLTISGNTLDGTGVNGNSSGIFVSTCTSTVVTGNELTGFRTAINSSSSPDIAITGNTTDNFALTGIFWNGGNVGATISGNSGFSGGTGGPLMTIGSNATVVGNRFSGSSGLTSAVTIIGSSVLFAGNSIFDTFVGHPTTAINISSGQTNVVIGYNDITPNAASLVNWNGSSGRAAPGLIFCHTTDSGNSGSSLTALYTDTLLANTLSRTGTVLSANYEVAVTGTASTTAEISLTFGGTTIFDSGALTSTSNGTLALAVTITQDSTTSVRATVVCSSGGAFGLNNSTYTAVTGLTLTGTVAMVLNGQSGGTGAASNLINAKTGNLSLVG